MKNILFVLPFFPFPLESGGHQAIFNGIIAVKDYANIFITYNGGRKDIYKKYHKEFKKEFPNKNIKIIPYTEQINHLSRKEIYNKICNKISNICISSTEIDNFNQYIKTDLQNDAYYSFINDIIKEYSIDIVQIEMNSHIDLVLTLPSHIKKIFVHHELRFVRNQLYLSTCNTTHYKKALVELEYVKEIYLLNKYDLIITLSSIDKDKLIQNGVKVPIHTSFAVVKSQEYIKHPCHYNKTLSFIGPETHEPNKIGLEWFLTNCWSILKNKDSSYQLHIIGKWSKNTSIEWCKKYKDIKFLGYVPNLLDAINNTTMIVPITIGSGIRMKILEAMSNKIPFVSTHIGAEGIPVINGKNCFLTDDYNEFANSILKLEDNNIRNEFKESSYRIIKEQYSLEALTNNRMQLYK